MIYCECIPDGVLLQFLFGNETSIWHGNGKYEIAKSFRKRPNKGLIGLVDEDPHSNNNDSYSKLDYQSHDYNLKTAMENGNHYVVLCPNLEDWVLYVAKQNNIDPAGLKLPEEGNALHKVINKSQDSYKKLLSEIGSDVPEFQKLKELLTRNLTGNQ